MKPVKKHDLLDRFEKTSMAVLFVLFFIISLTSLLGEKVKDVSNVVGVRDNQLLGYGLVVGLQGTGDGTTSQFTTQSLANLLQSVNIKIDQATIKSKNVAAVMVTGKLPPFARQGDNMDVLVSSIGDAKSLEGGTLLLTPLKGLDGKIYGVSQGPVSIGGLNTGGGGGQNHPTVGKVIGGGIVEREISYDIYNKQRASLSLDESSFENAVVIQNAINDYFKEKVATATTPRSIALARPKEMSMVEFLAEVRDVPISLMQNQRVVIDERTGTIIAGLEVQVSPVVVTHGGISIAVDDNLLDQQTDGSALTISHVTKALQKLGAAPKDVIAILEAIKKAGALRAPLEVI